MRTFLTVVAMILAATNVLACDACGCSLGGVGFGMIPLQQANFIGLSYKHQHFESEHPDLFSEDIMEKSTDRIHLLSLVGRFNIKERWMVDANVSYQIGSVISESGTTLMNGLTDPEIIGSYRIISKGDATTQKQVLLLGGLGVRFPLGNVIDQYATSLPGMQPGRAAFSGMAQLRYVYRFNNTGLVTQVRHVRSAANKYDYRYGFETTSQLLLFYRIKKDAWSWIPSVGGEFVHQTPDLLMASRKVSNDISGVELMNVHAQLTVFRSMWGARLSFQQPIYHKINQGLTKPNSITSLNLLKKL